MHGRIAIDLRGRSLKNCRPETLGQTQHLDRAIDARLGGLHRIVPVVLGRGRAGEIVDSVYLHVERESNIVTQQLEMRVVQKVHKVTPCAGKKVVYAKDFEAVCQQSIAQVRPEKARS